MPRSGDGLETNTLLLAPVGGRFVLPLFEGRIEPSVGFGGVYGYDRHRFNDQHQGGVYGLIGASYALDSSQHHRVGATVRYYNMISAGRPHPQWLTVMGEYTYCWGR